MGGTNGNWTISNNNGKIIAQMNISDFGGFDNALIFSNEQYCPNIQNDLIIYDASSIYNCNGAAISSPSGGFPPYTFNWNGNEGNNITTICSGNNVLNYRQYWL